MSISVLCVTRGERHAPRFLQHFALVASFLRAELVIARDRRETAERCCRIQGVPMQDPPRYWPSDYLDVATIPAGDGAI